jgi:ankyrin repeat protein
LLPVYLYNRTERGKLERVESEQDRRREFLQQVSCQEEVQEELSRGCLEGDLPRCQRALRCGADPNHVDNAGFLPIHYCSSGGHGEVARLLLEFGSDCSGHLTGHPPVLSAAKNGHAHLIALLAGFGAKVGDKGVGGCPAFIAAVQGGFTEAALLLLDLGADINCTDSLENTALHVVVSSPPKAANYKKGTNATSRKSSSTSSIRAGKELSQGPYDDDDGIEEFQRIKMIEFLIERGIDTTKVNKKGMTALLIALHEKNNSLIEALGGVPSPSLRGEKNKTKEINNSSSLERSSIASSISNISNR